jgi:hypothetical protein
MSETEKKITKETANSMIIVKLKILKFTYTHMQFKKKLGMPKMSV